MMIRSPGIRPKRRRPLRGLTGTGMLRPGQRGIWKTCERCKIACRIGQPIPIKQHCKATPPPGTAQAGAVVLELARRPVVPPTEIASFL